MAVASTRSCRAARNRFLVLTHSGKRRHAGVELGRHRNATIQSDRVKQHRAGARDVVEDESVVAPRDVHGARCRERDATLGRHPRAEARASPGSAAEEANGGQRELRARVSILIEAAIHAVRTRHRSDRVEHPTPGAQSSGSRGGCPGVATRARWVPGSWRERAQPIGGQYGGEPRRSLGAQERHVDTDMRGPARAAARSHLHR